MEKLKELLSKFKKWIVAGVVGIAVAFLAWKKFFAEEVKLNEPSKKEQEAKEAAAKKLAEETAKLEKQKNDELLKLEEEKNKKEAEILAQELKEKIRITKLAKEDSEAFKKEVSQKLGVREKKKGRPKKR
jgi:flagellar biosynthesis/type III secretory pathway M-ring protein FliF/YscJ